MRKSVNVFVGGLILMVMLTGCGTDAAVMAVQDQIAALGEITLDSETAVKAADEAYNALTGEQKAQIENADVLTDAVAKVDQLIKEEEDRKAVEQLVADGVDYLHGTNGKVYDPDEALKCFKEAASKGNEDAAFLAGYTIDWEMDGGENHSDNPEAVSFYEKVADSNPYAKLSVGYIYYYGQGVDENKDKAKTYFTEAIASIDPDQLISDNDMVYKAEAEYICGVLYRTGEEGLLEADPDLGMKLINASIDDGNVECLNYYAERINETDPERGQKLYEKWIGIYTASAEAGNADSALLLGQFYQTGLFLDADYTKALEYYQLAAENGNPQGDYYLGVLYCNEDMGTDYEKAFDYFKKAADAGDADAMEMIAGLYATGTVVDQDYLKALEYHQKAADAGNVEAMKKTARIYETGRGVDQDYAKALEYYQKAAESGYADGCNNLGLLYLNGKGVAPDDQKAYGYFEMGMNLGNAYSCGLIGWMYENGRGVEKDIELAKEWYKKGADGDDSWSQEQYDRLK